VTTKVEEIVGDPNRTGPKNLLPDFHQLAFVRVTRSHIDVLCVPAGSIFEPSSVDLEVQSVAVSRTHFFKQRPYKRRQVTMQASCLNQELQ
jgi:hypothetical protein